MQRAAPARVQDCPQHLLRFQEPPAIREVAVGRDQVAHLVHLAGLRGRTRLKRVRTTYADPAASRAPDLVQRRWDRQAPDTVWVSDFTYVPSREGTVYVSFLQDAFSRRILGFAVATSMGAQLVTRALD